MSIKVCFVMYGMILMSYNESVSHEEITKCTRKSKDQIKLKSYTSTLLAFFHYSTADDEFQVTVCGC